GRAQSIAYRGYDGTLTIGGGRGGGILVDAASGQVRATPSTLASVLVTARRLHETLLLDAGWLVVASTTAMLAMALLGILLGLPRLANTVSGWHKAMAWGLLPLLVLSPLTGLLLWGGVTFSGPPPGNATGQRPSLIEAVRLVGEKHDLSGLVWIRSRGGRLLARVIENGEYRVLSVGPAGAVPMPRNWPRLWHEGTFAGPWSAWMNIVTSAAMIGLLATGLWIWLSRRLRRRIPRRSPAPA
ncbi:MAG: PepSY domain-containing protein, partial [Hyphomicrobiaceae bacterium]